VTVTDLAEQTRELEVIADPEPTESARVRRPRPPLATPMLTAVWALTSFGLLAVWVLLYAFVLSSINEHRNQSVLYAALREQLSGATAPLGGDITPGAPLFVLDAPTGGVHHVVVVEGTTSSELTSGPGHLRSTPLPGQAGTSLVFGKSVTFGAPFAAVAAMHAGDAVTVTTGQGAYTYRVLDVRHPGDRLPPAVTAGHARLVLVSAVAAGWRGGWAPQQVVYVDADLTNGTLAPTPSGRPNLVSAASAPMQGDHSGLVVLVLWLSALLAVVVGAVWGRSRWGGWQTWLSAVPLLLACLWGATQAAVWLLPNLV
jgi:sortase A